MNSNQMRYIRLLVAFACLCHFVANAVSVATASYVECAVARTIDRKKCGEK